MEKEYSSSETASLKSSLKEDIARIAKLEFCPDYWKILDKNEEEGLYLIHSIIDPKEPGLPRGIVVDINNEIVVCDSFGFTPTAPLECLATIPETKDISIVDEYINRHTFPQGKYTISPAYEGVIVRAFKHNGIVYFSTHKKLDCSRSRWGKSDRFLEIYERLSGLKGDELFPESVITSPWCYQFLLVDKHLLVATKQDIKDGFIAHLGTIKMWDYDDPNLPFRDDQLGEKHEDPVIDSKWTIPPKFTLEEANEFLKYGYYQEEKDETNGESVIIYKHDDNGKIVDSVRIQSPSYHERVEIRGNDPNMKHRFFYLFNIAIKWDDVHKLLQEFPLFYREGNRSNFAEIWVEHCNQHKKLDL